MVPSVGKSVHYWVKQPFSHASQPVHAVILSCREDDTCVVLGVFDSGDYDPETDVLRARRVYADYSEVPADSCWTWPDVAEMRVYWVSWWVRRIDDPEVSSSWPRGVEAWISGEDMSEPPRESWCARIEAASEDAAKSKVLAMYGKFRSEIEWRFASEKPVDWRPRADRFPPQRPK